MSVFIKRPQEFGWDDLSGVAVIVQVIRCEGRKHVYLLGREAIYLVEETEDDTGKKSCPPATIIKDDD